MGRAEVARTARNAAQTVRLTVVAGGSVAASLGAHLIAGGELPASCLMVVVLSALAALATGVATFCAQRTRVAWAALVVLALGQATMTVTLAVPGSDHAPLWTLPSAALHAIATAGLGAILLGVERVLAGVARSADVIAPRSRAFVGLPPWPRIHVVAMDFSDDRGVSWVGDRPVRGPPTLV